MTVEGQRRRSILVIEDDQVLNRLIVSQLNDSGFETSGTRSWAQAREHLARHEPDLVLLDVRLPDADGLTLIQHLAADYSVIVLTAFGSIEQAVRSVKQGAFDYLVKPVNIDELELTARKAIETADLRRELQFVRSRQHLSRKSFMVGDSDSLRSVKSLIEAVAPSRATVLIQGESGVGKELVAREVHERSERAGKSFVAIDCCTLQESLFESELFGHEKGAFTGAMTQKKGLIEGAEGGTLFLDEIGEISPAAQAKLLRVIETGQFRRLGGVKDLRSDARIVAATNRDLKELADAGTFRADLYYRLSAFVINVPPLRERRGDISALALHFLANHDFSRRISKEISAEAVRELIQYDWPGNVRELRNVMERAIIISRNATSIRPQHLGLPVADAGRTASTSLAFDHEPTLEEIKQSYLQLLVERHAGHRARLAGSLGISERNLYRLLKKHGFDAERTGDAG